MTSTRLASPLTVTWLACLAIAGLAAPGCSDEEPLDAGSAPAELVPDAAPLSRLTAEQYRNTIRDLFVPLDIGRISFPLELEGRGGFENNVALNTATPALVEAYQRAALQVTERVSDNLDAALGCDSTVETCPRDWLANFAERAWRRPLTDEEQSALLSRYDEWVGTYEVATAVELSIAYVLQSPEFIYFPRFGADAPAEGETAIELTDWELAARLSYFLWNSTPDAELMDLARAGRLSERQVLADQAFRMLSDWRAVDMVISFHRQNWDFDDVGANPIDLDFYALVFESEGLYAEDDKSDYYYLEYSPQARFESDVYVAQHVFYGDGRLETLLTSNQAWVTPDVARVAYEQQVDLNAEPVLWGGLVAGEGNDTYELFTTDYYPIELDPNRRAGLFTMVGFLIAKAGPRQPAPVRRGVTIIDRLLCTELHPPGDVPPIEQTEALEPKTNTGLTQAEFSPSLAPLHPWANRMIAVEGLSMVSGDIDPAGVLRHEIGQIHCLTGNEVEMVSGLPIGKSASIDQLIANHIARPDRLRSLELSIGDVAPVVNYRDRHQPLLGEPRVPVAYQRLFGLVNGGSSVLRAFGVPDPESGGDWSAMPIRELSGMGGAKIDCTGVLDELWS